MPTIPPWDSTYPPAGRLRDECEGMLDAIVDEVIANLGQAAIVGIYSHGSSTKPWDSPVDYVPELSDVDVHILLREPERLEGDLKRALAIQAGYERRFAARCPHPFHFPRPQIQVINGQLGSPDWFSPPPGLAKTLFGIESEQVRPPPTQDRVQKADLAHLVDPAIPELLGRLPMWLIDRPGRYLWQALRDFGWRVGPTASRVLTVDGADYEAAWGGNRTRIIQTLVEVGEDELAEAYAGFYLRGWDYFRSEHLDAASAREAMTHAVRVLEIGTERGTAAVAAGERTRPP
jgi:hypothetical protein